MSSRESSLGISLVFIQSIILCLAFYPIDKCRMSFVFGMRQELVSLFSGVKDVSSALLLVRLHSKEKGRSRGKFYQVSNHFNNETSFWITWRLVQEFK